MSGNNLFNFSSTQQRSGLDLKEDSQVHLENLHNLGLLPRKAVNESRAQNRGLSDALSLSTRPIRAIDNPIHHNITAVVYRSTVSDSRPQMKLRCTLY